MDTIHDKYNRQTHQIQSFHFGFYQIERTMLIDISFELGSLALLL